VILQFAVLGLGVGAVYALTAFGIVLVYRGSGVVNFASGALATVGVYAFYELRDVQHRPWPLAMLIGVLVSGCLGALTHLLVMKPMRRTSPLTRTIATLGVLIVANAALVIWAPPGQLVVRTFYPSGELRLGSRVALGYDRLIITGIAVALALLLSAVWRWTRFGLATSAVAENRRSAASLGISPDTVATVNWFVGCALAGLAGIVLAPILGLQITTITGLLFPALAAALLGDMSSFLVALVGGLFLGIVQSIMSSYFPSTPGWTITIPFVLVLLVMMLKGRGIPDRGDSRDRLSAIGSGRVRLTPLILAVVVLLIFSWSFGSAYSNATTITMSVAIVVLSVVVVTGYAGQLSLCQYAIAGIGAFVVGRTTVLYGLPLEIAILLGVTVGFLVGVLVGMPALRNRGVNLAILTLGFAVVLQQDVFANGSLTSPVGDNVGPARLFGIDINSLTFPARYATFAGIVFILVALWVAKLRRGVIGRRLIAARDSERAAAALGINVYQAKLFGFAVSAAIAALGGVVIALRLPVFTYNSSYDYTSSINVLIYAVVGGVGYLAGPVLSSAAIVPGGVIYQLIAFLRNGNDELLVLIGGIGVIVVLQTAPNGMAQSMLDQLRMIVKLARLDGVGSSVKLSALTRRRLVGPADVLDTHGTIERVAPKQLVVTGLSVRYGGTTAVDSVSLVVNPGEVVGVIGANGAGKTTLVDAITGLVGTASGEIHLGGEPLGRLGAARRCSLGIGRSFQNLELFEDLTVYENLQTACDPPGLARYFTDAILPRRDRFTPAATAAVRRFGLEADLTRPVNELPYGRRRLCAIARAIAAAPSILLLDEPAAGLGDIEVAELAAHLRSLAEEQGMGVLLIEHNVEMLMSVSDRVIALDFGKAISAGTPKEVRRSEPVMRAYMGIVAGTDDTDGRPAAERLVPINIDDLL
jgi:ABC-type branched-subunit amino acid transport system ATPase component/ABC-type branched-subunit amino acid transport system permease subunit